MGRKVLIVGHGVVDETKASTLKAPSFGSVIRGARLGFHWHKGLQSMIRLSVDGPLFRVWMCPPNLLPGKQLKPVLHVCWWESSEDVMAMSEGIRAHAAPDRLVQFTIDDEGKEVAA